MLMLQLWNVLILTITWCRHEKKCLAHRWTGRKRGGRPSRVGPKEIHLEYDDISFGHRSGSYAFFLERIRTIPGFELRHAFVGTFPGNASTPDTQDL